MQALTSIKKASLPWHVLGAGAMGCLWGSQLQQSGQPVTFLTRDVRPKTLLLQNTPIDITAEFATDTTEAIHHLLVCVKAYDVVPALHSVEQRLTSDSVIVLMQNGMGLFEEVCAKFPNLTLLNAVTTAGAYRNAPFHITPAGTGNTWLGNLASSNNTWQHIVDSLAMTNFPVHWDQQMPARLWEKFAVSCIINPLTSLLQCKNGELLTNTTLIDLLSEEMELFLAARKINLSKPVAECVRAVAQNTADNYSSMLQDQQQQRPTEINYLNVYLLKQAKILNLQMPYHRMLTELILSKQDQQLKL